MFYDKQNARESAMPSAFFAFCRSHVLHNLFGCAFNALLDPLDDLQILALPACLFEPGVSETLENEDLRPDVHALAAHTDPDKVLLTAFQTFFTDKNVKSREPLGPEIFILL
jgi:hypothetical protein